MFDNNLKTRLVTYISLLIFLVAASFLAFYVYQMGNQIERQLVRSGSYVSRDLSVSSADTMTSETATSVQDVLSTQSILEVPLEEEKILFAAIYNEQGDIVLSDQKEEMSTELPDPIKQRLIENKETIKVKGENKQGTKICDFYAPIQSKEDPSNLVGFARVTISLEQVAAQRRKVFLFGGAAALLIIFIGSYLSYLIAAKIMKPVQSLMKGAKEFSSGNLEHRVETEVGGEVEELAEAFNRMAENLQESRYRLKEAKKSLEIQIKAQTKELKKLNRELEDRVQKRTQELQKRVDELERFHRLTVGREMKMIELKDKIKELKEKLEEVKQSSDNED